MSPHDSVEYEGETLTVQELCDRFKVPYQRAYDRRVTRNWPMVRACTTPVGSVKAHRLGFGKGRAIPR